MGRRSHWIMDPVQDQLWCAVSVWTLDVERSYPLRSLISEPSLPFDKRVPLNCITVDHPLISGHRWLNNITIFPVSICHGVTIPVRRHEKYMREIGYSPIFWVTISAQRLSPCYQFRIFLLIIYINTCIMRKFIKIIWTDIKNLINVLFFYIHSRNKNYIFIPMSPT